MQKWWSNFLTELYHSRFFNSDSLGRSFSWNLKLTYWPPIKDLPDKMTNMRGSYWILYSVIEYSQFIARRKSCTIWKELHCYGKWDESWVTISCWMSSFYHRMPRGSFVGASSVGNSYSSPSNHKSPGFFERSPLTVGIRKISGKRFFSLPSYHHGRENLASKLRRCQVEGGSV